MRAGWRICLGAIALSACSSGTSSHDAGNSDAAAPHPDLAVRPDLSVSPDLTWFPDLTSGDDGPPGTTQIRYVINKLTLPQARSDFAIDLNGDFRADNQLGNIVGALQAQNLDAQAGVDMSVATGTAVELFRLISFDPALQGDAMPQFTAYLGLPQPNPSFNGNGIFNVDPNGHGADFVGQLAGGKYSSDNPVTTQRPVALTLKVALFGSAPLALPLNGTHIQFSTGMDQSSGAPGLLSGQLQGSIKKKDIDTVLVPGIAAMLTAQIKADPNGAGSKQIEAIFDSGNCTNLDGSQAKAGDGRIDDCEVGTNSIIMNVLAPDVQIYDAMGAYAPNKTNQVRDSLSVGFGFTAVRCRF